MDRLDFSSQQIQASPEDYLDLLIASEANTEALPGELQRLLNAIAGANVFGTSLPGMEERFEARGVDPESPGGAVGQWLDWTGPLTKAMAAAPLIGKIVKGASGANDFAKRYPELGEPILNVDKKTGKEWLGRGETTESKQFMKDRNKVAKDVQAGNYDPYFKVEERYDAKGNYPERPLTIETAKPKKPETVEKWRATVKTPEARQRIIDAYQAGVDSGGHADWYKMGQLEDEFIKEYGPEVGPQMFRERFSDAMAATTGGADPTGNLLAAAYANFKRTKGEALPSNAYDIPSPVGGRYISGNMHVYDKALIQGKGLEGTPKRSNFSTNFEGNENVVTVDEHMTDLITPGKSVPPGDSYFAYEELIKEVAEELGIPPRQLQEVAWGGRKVGRKGDYKGKSMIEIVNEAIERTSRLTGVPPEEVVRKGLVRAEMPIYGMAGAAGLAGLLGAMAASDQYGVEQ